MQAGSPVDVSGRHLGARLRVVVFTGFPEDALVFFEGLEVDNSKAYWTDHKDVYDRAVRRPLEELVAALAPEFGTAKIFRPYRDVRFSKDKAPYKTQAAAVVTDGAGADGALYLAVSADGLFLAGGYYRTTTEQARRLRAAVADDRSGRALTALVDDLRHRGWAVDGEQLKRVPKPWDDAHPRASLLRNKSLTASRSYEPANWLRTAAVTDRVALAWRELLPLNAWLNDNVGPPRTAQR